MEMELYRPDATKNYDISRDDLDEIVDSEFKEAAMSRLTQLCEDARCISCGLTCQSLRKSKYFDRQPVLLFRYIEVCELGCRKKAGCLAANYCVPVYPGSPSYFVQCVNKNCNYGQMESAR